MDSEFLLEKKLAKENKNLSDIYRNMTVTMNQVLERSGTIFPNFTDHSLRHSMFVTQFCNTLVGAENIDDINVDEAFILLAACLLHDYGMCINQDFYDKYSKDIIPDDYFEKHPDNTIKDAVRDYHNDTSAYIISKYADVFEIPTKEHAYCISQVAKGHRKEDLFNKENYDPNYTLPNGNKVNLPYLAAIIRLADEMDIAQDRNASASYEEHGDLIDWKKHFAIKHLRINKDHFELVVIARSNAVFDICRDAIEKLDATLLYALKVTTELSNFNFRWVRLITTYIRPVTKRAVILSTDAGTDDAMALALIKEMGDDVPTYIVASAGNATLDQAVKNVAILRKLFGFKSQVVKGLDVEDKSNVEKNDFHGPDGMAGISELVAKELGMSEDECKADRNINEMAGELKSYDEIVIISIGPVNAVADLLERQEIKKKVVNMYIMGGGFKEHNCSHDTEFNFSKGPEAVKKILDSSVSITLFPLDLTNRQVLDENGIRELKDKGVSSDIITLLEWNQAENNLYNHINGAVLHDVMPILYMMYPQKFTATKMKVRSDEYGKTFEAEDGVEIDVITEVEEGLMPEALNCYL